MRRVRVTAIVSLFCFGYIAIGSAETNQQKWNAADASCNTYCKTLSGFKGGCATAGSDGLPRTSGGTLVCSCSLAISTGKGGPPSGGFKPLPPPAKLSGLTLTERAAVVAANGPKNQRTIPKNSKLPANNNSDK